MRLPSAARGATVALGLSALCAIPAQAQAQETVYVTEYVVADICTTIIGCKAS